MSMELARSASWSSGSGHLHHHKAYRVKDKSRYQNGSHRETHVKRAICDRTVVLRWGRQIVFMTFRKKTSSSISGAPHLLNPIGSLWTRLAGELLKDRAGWRGEGIQPIYLWTQQSVILALSNGGLFLCSTVLNCSFPPVSLFHYFSS